MIEEKIMEPNSLPSKADTPEERQYLDQANHAPYLIIFAWIIGIFGAFTLILLLGVF